MAAQTSFGKETAATVAALVMQGNGVAVVLAPERHPKLLDGDTLLVLRIALGLVDLADETGVHPDLL